MERFACDWRAGWSCWHFSGGTWLKRPTPPPAQKPLLWAADAEGGAPYVSMDPDHPGQYVGFEVDLIKALEKEIGRPIKFKQFNFTTLASALNRGDFDFAMNGMERTPDREAMFRLSRPYYVFKLQLVVRRDETRFASLDDCKQAGIRVGTLGDTAASRLLTQMGIPYRTYDSQTTPYKDLEQNQLDAVLLDLPIALQYTKRDPEFSEKLKFAGKPVAPGFYVIVFRKEERSPGGPVRRGHRALLANGTLRKIYEAWDLWNDDQAALETGKLEEALHTSATSWTFAAVLSPSPGRGGDDRRSTVLGFLLAMAIGLPVATARLYGPAPAALAGDGLRRVLPRHSRPAAAVFPLLQPARGRAGPAPGRVAEAQRLPGGRDRFRAELRRLRGRRSIGPASPRFPSANGRPGPRWECRRRGSFAASSFRKPSKSSCRP